MTQPDTGARESGEWEQGSLAAWETGPIARSPLAGSGGGGGGAGSPEGAAGPDHAGGPDDGRRAEPVAGHPEAVRVEPGEAVLPSPAGPLPPGQYIPRTLPVLHYGPVPAFRPESWDLRIFGATASGSEARLRWPDVEALPTAQIAADFHCVTKFTVPDICWAGVRAATVLGLFPPAPVVTHVMIWADFGYSANIRISDFAADDTMLATHRDGKPLTPEHGYPLRLVVPSLYAWKSVKWVRAIEYLTMDRRGFWEERGYHNTADPWREQRYSYQELDGEGPPL
jgi:DMSO/TMAO reductase YedYZ molybdopterin-dependent catalytic subunit